MDEEESGASGKVGETGQGWGTHKGSRLLIPVGKLRPTVSLLCLGSAPVSEPGPSKVNQDGGLSFPVPSPRGESLAGRGIFLKNEATETSTHSFLQAAILPWTLEREQGSQVPAQEEAAQGHWPFASHLLHPPLPRPAALHSTSCLLRPTLSKRLFFQKYKLSKTVSLPELESEIITPRNTRFLGKPFRASRCLWTRQSWVC